jgi:hypothetical protein
LIISNRTLGTSKRQECVKDDFKKIERK